MTMVLRNLVHIIVLSGAYISILSSYCRLQVRLNGAATFIGKVGLFVAVLLFFVLFIRYHSLQLSFWFVIYVYLT